MPEFKFRAWDKEHGHMIENVGIQTGKNAQSITISSEGIFVGNQCLSMILMQYTGMKDKNGKEIYEGDFFKDIADGYLWQVFYDEGCYYASSGPDTLMLQEFLMKSGKCDVEVVGNIYENSELITA